MKLTMRLAEPKDFPAVNKLRLDAYQGATWFSVCQPENIYVESDPVGTRIIVAFDEQNPTTLIGTVAIARTEDAAALETVLGAAAPDQARDVPVLTVIRLAVSLAAQGGGLNHAMRLAFLKAAQASNAVGFCSAQAPGTPNIPGLERLGYEFTEVPSFTHTTVRIENPLILRNWLPKEKYAFAIDRIEDLLAKKGVETAWAGTELAF